MKSRFMSIVLVVVSLFVLMLVTASAQDEPQVAELNLNVFNPAEAFGISLTEWMSASGTGTYQVEEWMGEGDMAIVDLSFTNLVPNGVYSLQCQRIDLETGFTASSKPCGLPDGSENVFVADANGNGAIRLNFPALAAATDSSQPVLAVVWHREGSQSSSHVELNTFTQLQVAIPAFTE